MDNTYFWVAEPRTGRKRHYDDPLVMLEDCLDYMRWVVDNPLQEQKATPDGKDKYTLDVMRAATMTGLRTFLEMSQQSWSDYKANPTFSVHVFGSRYARRGNYLHPKVHRGSGWFLNSNIIARDLGLADKKITDRKSTVIVQDSFPYE